MRIQVTLWISGTLVKEVVYASHVPQACTSLLARHFPDRRHFRLSSSQNSKKSVKSVLESQRSIL